MQIIETVFSSCIPLALIEDFIKEYFGWEKGSFAAVKLQFADCETKVFLNKPTDLLESDVEKLLKFFHNEIEAFNNDIKPHVAVKPDLKVNSGAFKMALMALHRSGKTEIANEVELTAEPL